VAVTAGAPLSRTVLRSAADGASRAVALADDAPTGYDRLAGCAAWAVTAVRDSCRLSAADRMPGPRSSTEDLGWLYCARPLAMHWGPGREPAAIVTNMRLNHDATIVLSKHPRP